MKYDFDEIIERAGTGSIKWSKNKLKEYYGNDDCIPMWIADMDFKSPQPVIDAVLQRATHGVFGYSTITDEFLEAAVQWHQKRNNWSIQKEWILFSTGVISALNYIFQIFCVPGDKVVIQSPVYYVFGNVIRDIGCHVENNPLIFKDDRYTMDFEHLDAITKNPSVKIFLLCNPHNPIGRVWTKEELIKAGEICLKNGVLVVSDDVHSDIVYKHNKYVPFASISEGFAQNSITFTAPTKSFNLAGLQISNIIVKNKRLREELGRKIFSMGTNPNYFACVAQVAAYTQGEEWLEQLLNYLRGNIEFIDNFIKKNIPQLKFLKPEATYLGWIDFSKLISDPELLRQTMVSKAKVALGSGINYGKGGENFQRINFACPRKTLEKALIGIKKAF